MIIFSDTFCPSSHKYAYLNGTYCCRTNKENIDIGKDDDLCDGSEIGIDSRCCENSDFVKCEYKKCINHQDEIKKDQDDAEKKTCFELHTDSSILDSIGDEITLFVNGDKVGYALGSHQQSNTICIDDTSDGDVFEFRNSGKDNVSQQLPFIWG